MIDAEFTRQRINYDPETGRMTWRIRPAKQVSAGAETGLPNRASNGYGRVKMLGMTYPAHRVAWLHFYGEWPKGHIDHINGVRNDNRIVNLRDAPPSINAENRRAAEPGSATGFLGVSKEGAYFKARIRVSRREIYLGCYDTPEEAHAVYLEAKRKHHAGCTI